MPVISLLTDFGLHDTYVGIMKAVILSRAPRARIVDLSHHISPQNLVQTAYLIHSSYTYFPKGTVHTIVVDPGVGSRRAIVALKTNGQIFLAPDNGTLTLILENTTSAAAVRVENSALFLDTISQTFHGRDIFAPVAAHLAVGNSINTLGPPIAPNTLVRLDIPRPVQKDTGEVIGALIDIDRFGNLITNLDEERIAPLLSVKPSAITITIGKRKITGLANSYADVPPGTPLAIPGSRGYIEISINRGNARDYFSATIGDPVTLSLPPKSAITDIV